MCGRYVLEHWPKEAAALFGVHDADEPVLLIKNLL